MNKLSYALGIGIGTQLSQLGTKEIVLDDFVMAIKDVLEGNESKLSQSEAQKIVNNFFKQKEEEEMERRRVAGEAAMEAGKKYLEENLKNPKVIQTPSGLQYRIIREGNGAVAANDEEVEVKYEGRLIDGTVFDSSYTRNPQTTSFRPSQVIKGWTEALKMMPEGSEWEVYIPQELAYGERQAGKIPPYSTLIFKLEVVKVKKDEKPAEDAKDGKKDNKKATKAKQTPKARK